MQRLNTPKWQSTLKNQMSATETVIWQQNGNFNSKFFRIFEKCFYEALFSFFGKVGISDGWVCSLVGGAGVCRTICLFGTLVICLRTLHITIFKKKFPRGILMREIRKFSIVIKFTTMNVCQILPEVPFEFFSWKLHMCTVWSSEIDHPYFFRIFH